MRSQVQQAVFAVLLTAATSAYAQQPQQATTETVGLEEIVVTAQRRSEALQDVPVAVSAFSEASLERLGISQALDVGRFIPNMFAHNNTGLGTANNYSLRALNNTESIATFDPPVGTYVDDVFIARQNGNNFAFFDIDRIEVLRGPQGTLFGRNTTGGAVNIILKKPAAEFGGFGEIGMGAWGKTMLRGSVDLPASDTLLTKFSAYFIKDDGYAHNYTTGETNNDNDNKGFRAAVRWLASEAATWDVSVDYMEQSYTNIINASVGDQRVSRTGLRETGTPLAGLFTGETSPKQLMGPVGIASLSGESAEAGIIPLLGLLASISLNLGLLNLLPIPVLDGGHILILLLEGIARRDFSMRVKERMLLAGFVLLMLLMVTVIYNDLTRVEWVENLMFWR